MHTQHIPKEHRRETHLSIGARTAATVVVLWMLAMGIHQVLRGPRDALRLDPKHIAVVTTLGAREASPRLPPRPFRNGDAALLSVVESSGQGHILVCSRTTISFVF